MVKVAVVLYDNVLTMRIKYNVCNVYNIMDLRSIVCPHQQTDLLYFRLRRELKS